jgi:hypothetical protein
MNIRLLIQNIGTKTLLETCPDKSSLYLISDSEQESIMVTLRGDDGDSRVVLSCNYEAGEFTGRIDEMEVDDEFMFEEELIEYLDLFGLDVTADIIVEGDS